MKNILLLFVFLILFVQCTHTSKQDYNSVLIEEQKTPQEDIISTLRQISSINEEDFVFLSEKMTKVIKNYKAIKHKLTKAEKRIQWLIAQIDLGKQTPSSAIEVEEISENKSLFKEDFDTSQQSQDLQDINQDSNLETNQDLQEINRENNQKTNQNAQDSNLETTNQDVKDSNQKTKQDVKDSNLEATKQKSLQDNQAKTSAEEKRLTSLEKKKLLSESSQANNLFKKAQKLFREKSWQSSISTFQEYRQEHPNSPREAEALFFIADSFKRLEMIPESKVFYKEVINNYPQSDWAEKAKPFLKK